MEQVRGRRLDDELLEVFCHLWSPDHRSGPGNIKAILKVIDFALGPWVSAIILIDSIFLDTRLG
jgi:hypothetical protein